jgi:DNA invertase Pin-like site-specific DNA recombinase
MLTVLGGLAEFERELIRARPGEGRKRAQERGVRFGRPRKHPFPAAGGVGPPRCWGDAG